MDFYPSGIFLQTKSMSYSKEIPRVQVRFILGIKNMEGEIVIKRWEDLDGEVSSYRLCCLLRLTSTLIRL